MNPTFSGNGHPSIGGWLRGGAGGGGFPLVPNQALASQTAWFIDPINGNNANNGQTLPTAIQTRSEFARRMFGVSLTQAITVQIQSSLLPGDDVVPFIFGNVSRGWSVTYLGVPVAIATGVITGYVPSNGATSTVDQVTIAGLPGTFTALGLLNRAIEFTNGVNVIRAVVVSDLEGSLGTRTAWVSPPLNENNLQGSVFTIGQTVNFWSNPDFRSPIMLGGFNIYKYLGVTQPNRWFPSWGTNQVISCSGGTDGSGYAGTSQWVNHANGIPQGGGFRTTLSGRHLILGGWNDLIAVGGNITFGAHATLTAIEGENGVSVNTGGQLSTVADIQFHTYGAGLPCIEMTSPASAKVAFQGFVYGDSPLQNILARCDTRDQLISFSRQPNVTNATVLSFPLSNVTELASRLTTTDFHDSFNNRIVGPAGAQTEIDRYQVGLIARGVLNETLPITTQTSSSILVAGNAYYIGIPLRAGDQLSNITLDVAVVGTVMTVSLLGLYDKLGNRLAVSADQGASWQTLGIRTAGIGPFTVPSTDMYYVGIFGAGTVLPTIVRGNATIPQHVLGAGVSYCYVQAGQVTLPNPAAFVVNPVVGACPLFWFELS